MGCVGLRKHSTPVKKQLRILLLGIAGSGKTTFIKQMQIIHKGGFDEIELENFKKILFLNILNGIKLVLELAIDNIETENRKKARYLLSMEENDLQWNVELVEKLKDLWKEESVRKAWINRRESFLIQLDYLMDNLDKYAVPGFVPTHADVLRARHRSTGETTTIIDDGHHAWNLVDMGGQLSERQKWEESFITQRVDAVIFFLSIDEFDTLNSESKTALQYPTKLLLALSVMKECFSNPVMMREGEQNVISRIVFLNKSDLFREKMKDEKRFLELNNYMGYQGNNNVEECEEFLVERVHQTVHSTDSLPTHTHLVCALDTQLMKQVTNDIKVSIVTNSLMNFGILI